MLLIAVALLVAAGSCGGASAGRGAVSGTAPLVSTSPTTAPSANATVPTTKPAQTTHPPLAGAVVPAPAGFSPSTRVSIHNGPVDAARFNMLNQSTTAAADLHFVAGYDVTFDSQTSSDDVEVTLVDFASSDDAGNFENGFSFSDQTTGSSDDPVITGAYDYNSPKANPDGSYDHGVIAVKGNRAMVIDYSSGTADAVPLVAMMAKQQYDRM